MLSEQDYDLLDKFFRSQLSDEEQRLFERKLKEKDFLEEFHQMESLQVIITSTGRAELRERFRQWDRETALRQMVTPFHVHAVRWISVAAAIVLLAIVIIFGLPRSQEQLYTEYLQPYPNIISPIQKSEVAEMSDYQLAFQLYESAEYRQAIRQFDGLPAADPAVQFYKAMSYLLNNNFSQSAVGFDRILNDPLHRFYQPAQWYRALIAVRLQNLQEATEQFQIIAANPQHPFSAQAQTILEEL